MGNRIPTGRSGGGGRAGRGARWLAAGVLLVLTGGPAAALDPDKALSQYGLESWGAKQGLVNGGILSIAQSSDGYLWLGTRRGLVRFNGVEFKLFDRRASGGLIGLNVHQIEPLEGGGVLFCSEGGAGLVVYRDGRFSAYLDAELPSRDIRAFEVARNGVTWIGSISSGLFRVERGRVRAFTAKEGAADQIKAILEARDGAIWVGTYGHGILEIRGDRIMRHGRPEGLPSVDVRAILEDADGTLWFSSLGGLVARKGGRFTIYNERDGLPHNRMFPLWRDRDGNLWIGTEGRGLVRRAGGRFATLGPQDGLVSSEIRSLCEDREGNLWFGSADGNLFRLKEERFTAVTQKEGLTGNAVRAVAEDRQGRMWVGGTEGLDVLEGGRATRVREAWAGGPVTSILHDRAGATWIGTMNHGLRRVQGGRMELLFPGRLITALLEDGEGVVWAGMDPGLERYRDGRWTRAGVGTGLDRARITVLRQGAGGVVWVGENRGILHRLSGAGMVSYSLREQGCGSSITSLHVDGRGALWIGSAEGLCRFEGGRFQQYSEADGLVEDQVSSILEDDFANLWLAGYRGFSRVSMERLRSYRRGVSAPLEVWFVEHPNGDLTSAGFQSRAAWRARDGRLWFASLYGVVGIDPGDSRAKSYPVPVILEEVLADRVPVAQDGVVKLAAGVRDLEFRFVGLSLGDPAGVRFKYRLDGLDPDWTQAGGRRLAVYHNVPAGDYRFQVTAANPDGVWNERPVSLAITKAPHLYETWWMRLALAAAAAGAAWLAYRRRMAGLRAKFAAVLEERNRIARELHDTVEQGLTGVMLQLDTVAAHWTTAPEAARRGLEMSRNMARHCASEARAAVRDLRTGSPEPEELEQTLRRMVRDFAGVNAPEIRVEVRGDSRGVRRDVAQALVRIAQEAVTNALKHARASRVELELRLEAEEARLWVRDDGVGFVEPTSGSSVASGHFGILGMRERANKLDGRLTIESTPGKGATVTFAVRLNRLRYTESAEGK